MRRVAFPSNSSRRWVELGYFGIRYPEEYGDSGGDNVMFALMCEELARGCMSLAASVAKQCLMGTSFVHRFGTEKQRQRLLVPAILGERIGVIAITEPDAGSDLGAMTTSAFRDGDGYILNGLKMWVTNTSLADSFTVAAKSDPGAGFRGIDMFLVEEERPGVGIGKDIAKMGVRGLGTGELILEEIRIMMGSLSLGLGRAALDAAVRYAQERVQFDCPIAHQMGL